MTAKLKPSPINDLYTLQKRAELITKAGEFAVAVEAIMSHHMIEALDDEGSPFSDREIGGLLGGLKIIGNALSDEGFGLKDELDAIAREVALNGN